MHMDENLTLYQSMTLLQLTVTEPGFDSLTTKSIKDCHIIAAQ